MDRLDNTGKTKNLHLEKKILQELKESGLLPQGHLQFQNKSELYKYLLGIDSELTKELSKFDLNINLEEHLEELHKYNSVKDATQSLLGSLSVQTGLSVTELHQQFGVEVKAVSLIFDDEVTANKDVMFGGTKSLRGCNLPCLKGLNLCSAANIFTSESTTGEILEELRWSLLENDFSSAAKLLERLLQHGSTPLLPVIWKNAFAIFLTQYSNSQECLEDFLEMCADQRSPEEKRKLIEMLVTLPNILDSRKKPRRKTTNKEESNFVICDDDDDYDDLEL